MGQAPSYPAGYAPGLTQDQIGNINQQGFTYTPQTTIGTPTGSMPFAQPQGYSRLTPDQIQAVQRQGFFNRPDATTGQGGGSLWDRITKALGEQGITKNWQQLMAQGTPHTAQDMIPPPANAQQMQMPRPGGLPQFTQAPFTTGVGVDMKGNLNNQLAAIQQLMNRG